MKWIYRSVNLPGNLHEVTIFINENHQDWDVVAMHYIALSHTIVVYRIEKIERPTGP